LAETGQEGGDRVAADHIASQLMSSGNVPDNIDIDERLDGGQVPRPERCCGLPVRSRVRMLGLRVGHPHILSAAAFLGAP
jgi:hypothetical protein